MRDYLRRVWSYHRERRQARREGRLFPECRVVVTFDGEAMTVRPPDGAAPQVVRWADLREVAIETNDLGPFVADLYWVLIGRDGVAHFPQGATGEKAAIERLQQLPGFDHEAMFDAMRSTDLARFVCWKAFGPLR